MMSLKHSTRESNLIVGYTTRKHLCLDLDKCSQEHAEEVAIQVMRRWHKVGDCLLVQSSPGRDFTLFENLDPERPYSVSWPPSWHLVFNNRISYNLVARISRELVLKGVLEQQFAEIRDWRGDITLRVSPCENMHYSRPTPKPVKYLVNPYQGLQSGLIDEYLSFLGCVSRLFSRSEVVAEISSHGAADKSLEAEDADCL